MSLSYTQNRRERVETGRTKEGHIAKALKEQHNLTILHATDQEDKEQKIDRWLIKDGKKIAVQIKYRETGEDILFEVFDRWESWGSPLNKLGRDMIGQAELYACLIKKNCFVIPTIIAKNTINDMLQYVQNYGWTQKEKVFRYHKNGVVCELRVQHDNASGQKKIVAYIPPAFFQAEVYKLSLPKMKVA